MLDDFTYTEMVRRGQSKWEDWKVKAEYGDLKPIQRSLRQHEGQRSEIMRREGMEKN